MTTDPDQIRDDIRGTQDKLSSDVEALTDKVSPPRIVKRRATRARTAVTNIKDKLMGSAADTTSTATDIAGSRASAAKDRASSAAASAADSVSAAASSVADTAGAAPQLVRERTQGNPLAVGLIAFGAGWLASSLIPASAAEKQVATQVKDTVTEKGRPVAQELGQAAQQLREPAVQAAQSVKETATGAAADVTEQARSAAGDVTDRAQEAKDAMTDHARSSGSSTGS